MWKSVPLIYCYKRHRFFFGINRLSVLKMRLKLHQRAFGLKIQSFQENVLLIFAYLCCTLPELGIQWKVS